MWQEQLEEINSTTKDPWSCLWRPLKEKSLNKEFWKIKWAYLVLIQTTLENGQDTLAISIPD